MWTIAIGAAAWAQTIPNGDFENGTVGWIDQTADLGQFTTDATFARGTAAGYLDASLSPFADAIATSAPFLVTREQLSYAVVDFGESEFRLSVNPGSQSVLAAPPSPDAFTNALLDLTGECGLLVEIVLDAGYRGEAWVDDVALTGPICRTLQDADGDGACPEGFDLDGDGLCTTPGEPTPGAIQDCSELDGTRFGCLSLTQSGVDEAPVAFTAVGATPGDPVWFYASDTEGSECPPELGGTCLGLGAPLTLLGTAVADALGVAEIVAPVPGHQRGDTVWLQTAGFRTLTSVAMSTTVDEAQIGPPPEPIPNGDFELGIADSWVPGSSCTAMSDTSNPARGSNAIRLDGCTPYGGSAIGEAFLVTHRTLRFARTDHVFTSVVNSAVTGGLWVALISHLEDGTTSDPDPFTDVWTDLTDACGERVFVSLPAASGRVYDDVTLGGPVCPQFRDADLDGWCPRGQDVDGDGFCIGSEIGEPEFDCDDASASTLCFSTTPLYAGETVSLTASPVTPGTEVWFVASDAPGETCPPGLGGACVGLAAPIHVLGRVPAGADGLATLDVVLPARFSGRVVYLEAVVPSEDRTSGAHPDLVRGIPGPPLDFTADAATTVLDMDSVAAVDLDGNGISELVVGVGNADGPGNRADSGAVYVLQAPFPSVPDLAVDPVGSVVGDIAGLESGASVASAGDIDGDGADDLLIGTGRGDGTLYLVPGPFVGAQLLSAAASAVVKSAGTDLFVGTATSGDLDGDGLAEVVVGDSGHVYGFRTTLGGTHAVDDVAGLTLVGEPAIGGFGTDLAYAGDVDGDGIGDLLVDSSGIRSYLFRGPLLGVVDASAADATIDLPGSTSSDRSLAAGGDLDGDGLPDLAFGRTETRTRGSVVGGVYAVSGAETGQLGLDDVWAQWEGDNLSASEIGFGVTLGDVDGNGWTDLVFGTDRAKQLHDRGVHIVLGPHAPGRWLVPEDVDRTVEHTVSGVVDLALGDLDGDGLDDLMMIDDGTPDLYVVLGSSL